MEDKSINFTDLKYHDPSRRWTLTTDDNKRIANSAIDIVSKYGKIFDTIICYPLKGEKEPIEIPSSSVVTIEEII